jgi:hypothetical protein
VHNNASLSIVVIVWNTRLWFWFHFNLHSFIRDYIIMLFVFIALALVLPQGCAYKTYRPINVIQIPSRLPSKLQMAPAPAVVRAAKTMHIFSEQLLSALTSFSILSFAHLLNLRSSTVVGGLLAGSLHAVTGPDHIAALLPSSVGQRWYTGMRIGAAWGLGHGVSATFLGLLAFLLKNKIGTQFNFIEKLSGVAESAVGVSLLLIGGLGLKETLLTKSGGDEADAGENVSSLKSNGAIFTNGILHGFSWDGAPSLAPALTLTSWRAALLFLLSYCFGTMFAMSATAGIVGEGTIRLGKATKNPDLPRKMSIVSSTVAIFIGAFWILQAVRK